MADEPKSKQVMVRMPIDLYETLRRLAESQERTLSQEVRLALRQHTNAA